MALTPETYPHQRFCKFCVDQINDIDYKDARGLRRYLSPYGGVMPGSRTGTCAKHQRKLSLAIKRARFMALLPYVMK